MSNDTLTMEELKTQESYKKAAVLLMNLEMEKPGSTKEIFSVMGEDMSKTLLQEMSKIESVKADETYSIFEEFHDIVVENKVTYGGEILPEFIFDQAFEDSTSSLFETKTNLFTFLEEVSDEALINYFQKESIQLIALIMHFLPEERMANFLSKMDKEKSITLSDQLVKLDIPNLKLIWKLQDAIKDKLLGDAKPEESDDESIIKLSRSLEIMNYTQQDAILKYFKETDEDVCAKIKQFMLTFPDLVILSDKDMQTLVNELESVKDLAIALKQVDDALKTKIYDNLSKRFLLMLEEEIKLVTDVSNEEIEENQLKILNLARKLERNGKITSLKKEATKASATEKETPKTETEEG